MPAQDRSQQTGPKSPLRRTAKGLFLAGISILVLVAAAFLTAPTWLPWLPGGDDILIDYERSQRLLRTEFGLSLPGEPDLYRLPERLAERGLTEGAPVLVRIFKREFELELWMQRDGVFQRFAVYPICRWSGWLGPKLKQGDLQTPEGFYTVDAQALNPNSRFYRSFNLGYPNAFDRANGRTGSLIMVHGGCASIGCFAMTNRQIGEIWRLVTAALDKGQKRFQVQVYPFRMSEERLAKYDGQPDLSFWRTLKAGDDLFETKRLPPRVSVCRGSYRFEAGETGAVGDAQIEERCPPSSNKP